MAGGGGGGGGKRSANAELNLVPYIDLLSTLICFLLITAVWQNVTVISTNSSIAPPSDPNSFNLNQPQPDKDKVEISIKITQSNLEFTANKIVNNIPYTNSSVDRDALRSLLDKSKLNFPDVKEIVIHSETGVKYKYLVQAMDVLADAKYNDVAINTN